MSSFYARSQIQSLTVHIDCLVQLGNLYKLLKDTKDDCAQRELSCMAKFRMNVQTDKLPILQLNWPSSGFLDALTNVTLGRVNRKFYVYLYNFRAYHGHLSR